MTLIAGVTWRQTERMFGELGRDSGRAAITGQSRGVVEHNGNVGVRRVPGQREVARAGERIFDDSRDAFVNALTRRAEILVEDRRQQRVGEANRAVLALDHVRGDRRVERICGNAGLLKERLRCRSQRRRQRQRLPRGRRELGDPCAYEFLERLRNRERLKQVDVDLDDTGQLQPEERISSRSLVDAEQRLAREGPPEPVAEQPMERADAERSHRQPLDAFWAERMLESWRVRSSNDPPREQQEHLVRGESPQRECERIRRGSIQPLKIVDRHKQWRVFGE